MEGEETTLWTYGGGIDPAAVVSGFGDEVRMRTQFVVTGGDRTITDLGVRLERDLVERLDPELLATEEDRHRLRLRPQRADWAEAMYIRAEPTGGTRKFDRTVMRPDGYPTVGLPRGWLRNSVVSGIDNPFQAADAGDHVVARYLPEGAIEIYTVELFNAHPRFTRLRALAPLAVLSGEESEDAVPFDRPAAARYGSQVFEIVPFDFDLFEEACQSRINNNLYKFDEDLPTPADFHRIFAEGAIEPVSPPYVVIDWEEEPETGMGTEELGGEETETWMDRKKLGHEKTGGFRVELPARGAYYIGDSVRDPRVNEWLIHRSSEQIITDPTRNECRIEFGNDTDRFNRKYFDRINQHWWGRFFEVPEHGPPIVYIPLVSSDEN